MPAAPPYLAGRDAQVEELLEVLAPGEGPGTVVVSAVHGLAGVGKTALALTAAHQAVERGWFGGAALFVEMAGYDPAGGVSGERAVGMLLRALGVAEQDLPPTPEEQAGLYRAELARRARQGLRVLVVADNVSSAGQVRLLVPGAGTHRLLVTSRDTLASLTEVGARLIGLEELTPQAAADLIGQTLLRARPADPRPAAEPGAVEAVAGWCGRLPLALQIAAAFLVDDPGLSIAQLGEHLADERTRLDRIRPPDTPEQAEGDSAPVRAAFALSYRRLNPSQQRLFRLLAVNPGPHVGTDAAAALTAWLADQVRPVLAALARASLLAETPAGSGRWRMHDLIKVYAAELADTSNDDDRHEALDRLLEHYATAADAAADHLRALPGDPLPDRFRDRQDALAWLDAERSNLIAAVPLAATTHPPTAIALTASLAQYLDWRRLFHDAITIGHHALAAARQLGDQRYEGMALNNLGLALVEVRRFEEAIDAHTRDLSICRELGDQHREGTALNNLGTALQEVRRLEEAIDAHTRAATIYQELSDRHGEASALNNLGLALREVRRLEEAIDAHTRAATIYQELSDRHREGTALNNLGIALREVRRFEEAIDAHTRDLSICRELGDQHREGTALNNLGTALQEVRRLEEAIDACTRAATIYQELGDQHREGMALNNLSIALRRVRRLEEAIDACTRAATIFRELGDQHGEGSALTSLGFALREVRRFEEAIDAHNRAATIFRELGDQHREGMALNNLGTALQEVRRFEEAIDAHNRAATIYQELSDRHREGTALNNLRVTRQAMRRGGRVRGWWRRVTGR
ncbi:tetratricopeptide repeat protein [Actinomadura miaoliensis]|uniref:AfsR-like transcriptional regulator TcrA n=1 Tax=Actinomadura miaoliensis TaxID=430685 RepID=A0ABP7X2C5_9ACTN